MAKADIYLFTEEEGNAELLHKLLPEAITSKVTIKVGGSYSSALADARTTLRENPDAYIIMVLDTDTMHASKVEDRYSFIAHYLSMAAEKEQFKVFLQIPRIEMIAFENKALTERIIQRELTDLEFKFAKENPRKNLEFLMETEEPLLKMVDMDLDETCWEEMRGFDFPKQLLEHLESLID